MLKFKTTKDVFRNQDVLVKIGFDEEAIIGCILQATRDENDNFTPHHIFVAENTKDITLDDFKNSEGVWDEGNCYVGTVGNDNFFIVKNMCSQDIIDYMLEFEETRITY